MATASSSPAAAASPTVGRALELLASPLLELVHEAARVHREHHDPRAVQCAHLFSIKTGACPEDCGYCSQSAHHGSGLQKEKLTDVPTVEAEARRAREAGADRLCLGAAWRDVKDGPDFDRVLDMVKAIKAEGLEACATLGMLNREQAGRLREAEPLSPALVEAIADVALALDLAPDWLNPGPASLLRLGLPPGFQERAHHRDYGALQIWLADRVDQVHLKLYAAADDWPDRSRHLRDLEGLSPSPAELRTAARGCRSHDPSEGFREMLLVPVLRHLGVEVEHE